MTVQQARMALNRYCGIERSCDECPLGVDGFRCGCGVSFLSTSDDDGSYDMNDDEIWEHYDALAAAGYIGPRVVIEYELAPVVGLFE